MIVLIVIVLSIVFQFGAAIMALRLIRLTGTPWAWALIAAAMALQIVRRLVSLEEILRGDLTNLPLASEIVGLILSVLMLAGVWLIGPFFRTMRKNLEELEEAKGQLSSLNRELSRRAGQLDLILQNINEGVTVFDATGRIILRNRTARSIAGVPDQGSRGLRDDRHILRPFYLNGSPVPPEEHPICRLLAGEEIADQEYVLLGEDGKRKRVSFSGSRLIGEEGALEMSLAMMHDVTRLRESERSKDDLLRMVTHDLRSPLAVIKSWAQLAEKTAADPVKVQESMEKVTKAVGLMQTMIGDLIESARLEAGQLLLRSQPLDLPEFLDGFLEDFRDVIESFRVQVFCMEEVPLVQADPKHLERILVNLLTNALRYSPADSLVTISLSPISGEVLVAVKDNGSGIGPEHGWRIFERFYRMKASPEREEGLGLGLYIAKGLVEAHGGRIWYESEPGCGSTFYFTLPAVPHGDSAAEEDPDA